MAKTNSLGIGETPAVFIMLHWPIWQSYPYTPRSWNEAAFGTLDCDYMLDCTRCFVKFSEVPLVCLVQSSYTSSEELK